MTSKVGITYAVVAAAIYGVYPIYFKQLPDVRPFQLVCHRVVWSFVTLIPVFLWQIDWTAAWRDAAWKPKVLGLYLASGVLIASFWCFLLWGIHHDYIVETSLGGFVNPIFSVLLAVAVLKERLRLLQWVAVALAILGVLVIAIAYGRFPWLAISMGALIAAYGFLKRLAPLGAIEGVVIEMAWLLLPAIVGLIAFERHGTGAFGHVSGTQNALLVLSGIVTVFPLLLLSRSAQLISFTLFGVIQFIYPIINVLVGVFIYHEPFSTSKLTGFVLVWLALSLYTVEGIIAEKQRRSADKDIVMKSNEDCTPQSPTSTFKTIDSPLV
ncbi:unnamed protein product [Aphanomyces euteiches]|nr:hypothetical protein AeRB84_006548 [Aphanomyces euteiches]